MPSTEQTSPSAWTIRRMMAWMTEDFQKRGLASPRLDAELLVAHALDVARVRLYLEMDRPLEASELKKIRSLVERRRLHEPVAYILGKREFYGRTFAVTPAVLIPRPDTETLVDRALEIVDERGIELFWDICCGSGAIGVAMLASRAQTSAILSDISADALSVAQQNAKDNAVEERASFLLGDLFAPFENQKSDLICVNPPYVSTADMQTLAPDVRDHEPNMALEADDNGFGVIRKIVEALPNRLTAGGVALLECGQGQAETVVEMATQQGLVHNRIIHDLAGIGRVVEMHAQP